MEKLQRATADKGVDGDEVEEYQGYQGHQRYREYRGVPGNYGVKIYSGADLVAWAKKKRFGKFVRGCYNFHNS